MPSIWFSTALLDTGWARDVRITVDDGAITGVAAGVPAAAGDDRGGIGLPGLANVHSHGFQRGMAGLTEYRGPTSDNFWTWRQLMYRFLDRLNPDDIEAITAQAYVEMLAGGFTAVGEFHYLHQDPAGQPYANVAETAQAVLAAAAATGIGITLLPVFYAHGGFGGAPAEAGQRRFLSDLDGFAKLLSASHTMVAGTEGARIGVAPHSLRAVTPDELTAVIGMAGDGPIHIHAAEQTGEVEQCLAWSGARPVEWLLDHGIDDRWCLIHATHLNDRETERLAASDAVAGICPVTEANLGDGIFPAEAYLAAGGALGIGTDSNIVIDAGRELQAIEYSQRLLHRRRNVLAGSEGRSTGASLFARALEGGARSLGRMPAGLAVGAAADIVELDEAHVDLAGRRGDTILDAWVFAGRPSMIRSVWARGRKVVVNGAHVSASSVAARYASVLARLLRGD